MSRTVYVVSGIQGAGKTSVARVLAERVPRSAHIEADVLQKMIVSGRRWPTRPQLDDEQAAQLRLRARNASLLADSFFEAGFTPIIDDIAIGRWEHFQSDIRSRPLILVMLDVPVEEANERFLQRTGDECEDINAVLDAEMRTMPREGIWVEGADKSPDEIVDEILERTPR